MSARFLQVLNTYSPIVVTPLGIFALVILKQLAKAYLPILVTSFGMTTLVKPLQFLNA